MMFPWNSRTVTPKQHQMARDWWTTFVAAAPGYISGCPTCAMALAFDWYYCPCCKRDEQDTPINKAKEEF
jgi:hypothetical protein